MHDLRFAHVIDDVNVLHGATREVAQRGCQAHLRYDQLATLSVERFPLILGSEAVTDAWATLLAVEEVIKVIRSQAVAQLEGRVCEAAHVISPHEWCLVFELRPLRALPAPRGGGIGDRRRCKPTSCYGDHRSVGDWERLVGMVLDVIHDANELVRNFFSCAKTPFHSSLPNMEEHAKGLFSQIES